MVRLLRTADSRDDLTAIWLYIAQDNISAADRFVTEVDHTLSLLATFPFIGEVVDWLRPGTRRFTIGNYQLFYEPIDDDIRPFRVYDAVRGTDKLFD